MTAVLAAGCGTVLGQPVAGDGVISVPVDTGFVHGTDHGSDDELAAAAVTDVQDFWRQRFPSVFHKAWTPLRGGFVSVDTADPPAGPPPPCTDSPADVEGNAFYCPDADAVAWDRSALLPVLRERFGDAAVVVVFAHELGHAVQQRTGLDPAAQRADPAKYPTIVVESMADCYAGAFFAWAVAGHAPHLRLSAADLDPALSALVNFADPVGDEQQSGTAHGDAYDRVTAFAEGYGSGPAGCAGMTAANHTFTAETYAATPPPASNPDVAAETTALTPDLAAFFGPLAGPRWHAPAVRTQAAVPGCGGAQGPVALCGSDVVVGTGGPAADLDAASGGYAPGLLLVTRYALAAEAAAGRSDTGPAAVTTALCLAGAYTADRLTPGRTGVRLAVSDLDAAVAALLGTDAAGRDARGAVSGTGFDRLTAFRSGFSGGVTGCGLH